MEHSQKQLMSYTPGHLWRGVQSTGQEEQTQSGLNEHGSILELLVILFVLILKKISTPDFVD